ncbi:unnamed protein product [Calypogeia fissa]
MNTNLVYTHRTVNTLSTRMQSLSQEEVQRIKAFRLPNFVPPYPSKMNPLVEKVRAETWRWVEKFSLDKIYKTPKELQSFYKTDIPALAMAVYVDAGEKEAAWGCKYVSMVFLLDDLLDDMTNFCCPEKATSLFLELSVQVMWTFPDSEQLYRKVMEILDEGEVTERSQALSYLHSKLEMARRNPGTVYDTSSQEHQSFCKAFRDLWATLCETAPGDFLLRWGLLFLSQLLSYVREMKTRKYNSTPSIEEYIADRRDTGAVWTCLVNVEFLDKAFIPDEVYYCPEMQRFLIAVIDAVGWHNDLWSFQKEALKGDVHNLVIVISHAEDCSYAKAGEKVYHMMLDKLVEMEKCIKDLERVIPRKHQRAMARYFHMARTMITGHHYFNDNCVRYIQCA